MRGVKSGTSVEKGLQDDRVLADVELECCEVCLRYFTKSLRATVFMQTVYSTVV